MTTPFALSADRRDDGTIVLVVTGEIDLSNAEAFAQALAAATAQQGSDGRATVDLSGVEFLDSGAIKSLFAHAEEIQLIVNPVLLPVLTISGLTELTTVEQSSPPDRATGV